MLLPGLVRGYLKGVDLSPRSEKEICMDLWVIRVKRMVSIYRFRCRNTALSHASGACISNVRNLLREGVDMVDKI